MNLLINWRGVEAGMDFCHSAAIDMSVAVPVVASPYLRFGSFPSVGSSVKVV